jgi:subtilisin-like proprotein convertase family protein
MKKITQISRYLFVIAGLLITQYATSQNSWNIAAIFDGNCYFKELNSTVNGTSGEMTVEFWIKLNTSNGDFPIIGKNQFRIMTDANNIRVQVNGSSLLYSTAKLDSGKWTHVAVTFSDANNEINIYLNGSLDNSYTTFNGAFAGTNDTLFIGKNNYLSNKLEGELDEVRIWNTVRTSSEILYNYRTHIGWYTTTFYDSHLIFCQTYDFDVYSPGIYFPHGGGFGTFGSDIIGNKPSQTVIHNNSMYFTGSSYLESNSANDPNISLTGAMTVEAWIYPSSIGTKQTILDLKQGGTGGYALNLESSGNISWSMNQTGPGDVILTANKWYHIAVVCETPSGGNQVARIYINGTYDKGYNYTELIANTGKLRIGVNSSTTNYFTGFIDEVRISNYAKTPAEIQRNMHTPILYLNKPVPPNTTVAYNFDGNMYSGTRDGGLLINFGCRFSYYTDVASPLFHLGYPHELTLDSLVMKHPFTPIPATGTAGYTYDTLNFNSAITLDENKIKVFLSISHAYTHDLRVELFSPDGDSVTLVDQIYPALKGFTFMLNNQSEKLISDGIFKDIAPIIGSANHFSVFNGKNSQGDWILKITDLANGNTGVLNSWGLILDGVPFGSVSNIKNEQNFDVFPNPSSGKFTIALSSIQMTNDKFEIYNVLGEKVYQSIITYPKTEIDFSTYPKGVYFVKVSDKNKMLTQKLIIQ